MKKLEKGFVIPLIIAIVAILAIGGTVYFANHGKVEAPIVIDTNLPSQIGTTTEARPRIDIINPTSASVGTVVQIRGVNFSGFEGDKNAWIVSKVTGVKGIIYGSVPSSDNLITFPLSQTYCTIDTSYSGQACPAVLDVTPGDYEIYIINPKGTSNKIPFTVTKSIPIACTMDAMMCPDGSYVGRSGPNCQFVCPK